MRHKKAVVSVILVIIAICLILLFHVCAIHIVNVGDYLSCTSVAFDKHRMSAVDRIELYNSQTEKSRTITDRIVIRALIKETTVATCAGIQCPKDIEIKLYDGNDLVRVMYCGDDYTKVKVYDADGIHWILHTYTGATDGYVLLSNSLQQLLLSLEW